MKAHETDAELNAAIDSALDSALDTDASADETENFEVAPAAPFSLSGAKKVSAREDKGVEVVLKDEFGDPLTVLGPDNNTLPAVAIVAGKLSARYRSAEQRINDRTLKRRQTDFTAEILERNEIEKIAACVLSWNLTDNGKPIPADLGNVRMVLQVAPWIRRDLEAAMSEPARFLA